MFLPCFARTPWAWACQFLELTSWFHCVCLVVLSDRVFLFHLDVENQPFAFLDTRSSSNNEGNAEEELTYEYLFCVIVNLIVFKLYIFGEVLDWCLLKDGAYYCYCAYVLRISIYSDFLSPMLTNTGIFLRGLKLSGESRS